MILIEPNGLYTRSDLADLLEPAGINVDTFVGKLKPAKVFKMIYRGKEILEAYDEAVAQVPVPAEERPRNGARKRVGKEGKLIGDVFDPKKLGIEK